MENTLNTIDKYLNKNMRNTYVAINKQNAKNTVEALVVGNESILDTVIYKIDKAIQKGIVGIVDFINTTNVFVEGITEYKTKTPSVTSLYSLRKDFVKIKNDIRFDKLANRKVPVIMGLKVPIKNVLDILETSAYNIDNLEKYLNELDNILTDLLSTTNKDYEKVIDNKFNSDTIKNINKFSEKIDKDLKSIIDDKVLTDRQPLRKVIKSVYELEDDINRALKLGLYYKMERLEELYDFNSKISETLKYLAENMHNTKSNGKLVKELMAILNSIARYITSVAFLFYIYYQVTDMLIVVTKIVINENDRTTLEYFTNIFKTNYQNLIKYLSSIGK